MMAPADPGKVLTLGVIKPDPTEAKGTFDDEEDADDEETAGGEETEVGVRKPVPRVRTLFRGSGRRSDEVNRRRVMEDSFH